MNGPEQASALVQMAPFALILVVFYFLLIRPQQKKAKETQEMQDNLKVGDPIVSTGGIHGKVTKVGEKDLMVEIAPKVQIRLSRTAVGTVARSAKSEEKS